MADIRSEMASGHPIGLLMLASQILEISAERPSDMLTGDRDPGASRDDFLASLLGFDSVETTALLHALLVLLPDVSTAAEIHSELERRRWSLPGWIRMIGEIEFVEALEMKHILGDGENAVVEVRWPSGRTMAVLVYIDHNLGTVVKDAFPAIEGIDELRKHFVENAGDDSSVAEIDPADARARIEQAIKTGERVFPPLASETWPGCRSLVEFVARRLPSGGAGFERPTWTETQLDEISRDFFGSHFGASLTDDTDARSIVDDLLWFSSDYGPGDPLRWSSTSIEILFLDWFPRKIMGDGAYMRKMPVVARAFVSYAHDDRSIPAHLTVETLDAIDHWEPEYRNLSARSGALMDVAQFLHEQISDGPYLDGPYLDGPIEKYMLTTLAERVGGRDELDHLSDEPIPDEEFDWSGIPDDTHARVREILGIVDRCADELLDTEYRTIVRRLLARAASGDPDVFRRKARTDYAAAALVWTVGKANDLFSTMSVKDLMTWFGIQQGSVSQRAQTLRKAAGIDVYNMSVEVFGDTELLHSTKRRSIITLRDRYVDRLKQEGL